MQNISCANVTERQTDWNAINWRKANRIVRNLRQRIFRASTEGNLKKVRSLQKLMLRSYSNILVSVRRVTQVNKGSPVIASVLPSADSFHASKRIVCKCLKHEYSVVVVFSDLLERLDG